MNRAVTGRRNYLNVLVAVLMGAMESEKLSDPFVGLCVILSSAFNHKGF